tara:strand:- start:227 stop:484 length:258 start_codon:yes stop_codon:yes gene_type:complete
MAKQSFVLWEERTYGSEAIRWRESVQAGDLIREKEFPEDSLGVVVHIGDMRTKKPYKVFCPYWGAVVAFAKEYVQEQCEVISASR